MTQDWLSHVQVVTTSTGTGDLVLGAAFNAEWQAFSAGLHGRYVDVEIEHETSPNQVEVGRFLYEHTPTPTLRRSLGGTEWSVSGVGVPFNFLSGNKLVSITVNGRTLRELVLFRGGGRTINEDTDFSAGTQFTASLTNHQHRALKVLGNADGLLTQPMTVNLPAVAGAEWGDEIYVEKGDASTFTVTVSGFDNGGTGTHILRRQDQYIIAKVVGTTTKKWERQRGGQQTPSAAGQDVIRAVNPGDQMVTGGAAKIRDATNTLDGLATPTQISALLVPGATVRTGPFTAVRGVLERVNTSSGTFTATLPSGADAPVGCIVGFLDANQFWETNALVLTCTDGSTIDGFNPTVTPYNLDGGNSGAWARTSATTWRFLGQTGMMTSGGGVPSNLNGQPLVNYTSPHVPNVSGELNQGAHGGRACLITGAVTIPITDGFQVLLRNKSGTTRSVAAVAGGSLVYDGLTVASVNVPHLREVSAHADGSQVWISGTVA